MADVSSSLNSWSTTASSNLPNDNTTIGSGMADNLQAIQAVVRGDLATKGSDIASSATPDLGAVTGLYHDITGANTITGLGSSATAGIWKILQTDSTPLFVHSTAMAMPGSANFSASTGDVLGFLCEATNQWRCLFVTKNSTSPFLYSGRYVLSTIRSYTGDATWSKPAGCTAVFVRVQAPGGGGGGADGGAANAVGAGGGGGGGGYSEKFITSGLNSAESVTVGSVGAAGSGTNGTSGGTGGTASFGSHCSVGGGVGGTGSGAAAVTYICTRGGAGGAGANGTINTSGGAGGNGTGLLDTDAGNIGFFASGGVGGSSVFGAGGAGGTCSTANTTSMAGTAGASYGGGGGGGASWQQTGVDGGAGGGGLVMVYELY